MFPWLRLVLTRPRFPSKISLLPPPPLLSQPSLAFPLLSEATRPWTRLRLRLAGLGSCPSVRRVVEIDIIQLEKCVNGEFIRMGKSGAKKSHPPGVGMVVATGVNLSLERVLAQQWWALNGGGRSGQRNEKALLGGPFWRRVGLLSPGHDGLADEPQGLKRPVLARTPKRYVPSGKRSRKSPDGAADRRANRAQVVVIHLIHLVNPFPEPILPPQGKIEPFKRDRRNHVALCPAINTIIWPWQRLRHV